MFPIQKNRRACDKCHRQKLSCKRRNATSPCMRCIKSGLECSITPKPRRLRQSIQDSSSKEGEKSVAKIGNSEVQFQRSLSDSSFDIFGSPSPDSTDDEMDNADHVEYSLESGASIAAELRHDIAASQESDPIDNEDSGMNLSFENSDAGYDLELDFDDFSQCIFDAEFLIPTENPHEPTENTEQGHSSSLLSPPLSLRSIIHEKSKIESPGSLYNRTQATFELQKNRILKPSPNNRNSSKKPETTQELSKAPDWMKVVLELNAALCAQSKSLQDLTEANQTKPSRIKSTADILDNHFHYMDQTFILSHYLFDIYRQICSLSSGLLSERSSETDDNISEGRKRLNSSFSEIVSNSQHHSILNDSTALLVLISCRERLLTIYRSLLLQIQEWFRQRRRNSTDNYGRTPHTGIFSLPHLLNLKVSCFLEIIGHFLNRFQMINVTMDNLITSRSSSQAFPSIIDVPHLALDAIDKKEIELLRIIRRMQTTLNTV